jgi:adenylate cyclase
MATEIERKFLVRGDGWRRGVASSEDYHQGYLANNRTCSVRVRVSGDQAFLNIKSAQLGISRLEYEYPIPRSDAEEMLNTLCISALVEKTRYFVPEGDHTWEVDVFAGDNMGLIVAEIELTHGDEPFHRPEWLGEEVSHDHRYYNVYLAEHPFKTW